MWEPATITGAWKRACRPAKAFNDAFRRAYANAVPTDYGAYGYTALRSLLMAVKTAGDTDTDKVIAVLESLQYDVVKGPEHYRACDHQAIQSVLVTESKKKSDMQGEADLFRILEVEPGSEAALRSCDELGHRA